MDEGTQKIMMRTLIIKGIAVYPRQGAIINFMLKVLRIITIIHGLIQTMLLQ